ncbi:zincin-like metallopeptidase toxin domain-containing protein [Terribacillus saccharophilus]|nr:zincin-like metallopeptidase toxin domain-containing protein [Terribacillus saccharophilus]MCM3225699.1 hypothetical protein [Terribacillus saccharophilus]MEC0291624.1 zincin-like metallopeptidase toxin domain-containing protein [Terribacillus saccharophilus]
MAETGQIYLRRQPTLLSALNESYHAQQWRELGKENYLKQSTLEREEYVYRNYEKSGYVLERRNPILTEIYL